jgi:hypothetical protein
MNQRALEAKEMAAREAQSAPTNISPMSQSTIPSNMPVNPMLDISSSSANSIAQRTDPAGSVDDEEGKRSLITNEIQMFRDRFKDEDTKMRNTEKERKDRYERERLLQREKRTVEETAASGNNKSAISPSSRNTSPPSRDRSSPRRDHNSSSTNRRDRSSPNDDRYRNSSSRNHTSNSIRSRAGDRRNSPPSRYDRRSPVSSSRPYSRRSRTKSPVSKTNNEDDEETYERKRQERRLREKELHYREVSHTIIYFPNRIRDKIESNTYYLSF